MARRRRKQDNSLAVLLGAAVCIYVLFELLPHNLPLVVLLAVAVAVIVTVAIVSPLRTRSHLLFLTAHDS